MAHNGHGNNPAGMGIAMVKGAVMGMGGSGNGNDFMGMSGNRNSKSHSRTPPAGSQFDVISPLTAMLSWPILVQVLFMLKKRKYIVAVNE